jgi:hypothetical protein
MFGFQGRLQRTQGVLPFLRQLKAIKQSRQIHTPFTEELVKSPTHRN